MNRGKQQIAPTYNDGGFELYDLVDVPDPYNPDFPVRMIRKRNIGVIGYRELSIYDRTRITFEQADKQITLKVAIPRWGGISTDCVVIIGGTQHKVFNCAHVISKQGYPETELTLVKPDMHYEVTE